MMGFRFSGVDEGFLFLGVEHLDAHVDDVAWGEVLPFFALRGFVDEVLECLVNDIEVGVEELDVLEGGDADGEVGGGELELGVGFEDAFPFSFAAGEEVGDFCFEFGFGVAVVSEFEVSFFVPAGGHFIEKLCEDELEEFLEDIDASIGEDFVFHFQDEVLEGFALVDELVLFDEVVDGPALGEDIGEFFDGAGNAGEILEVVRVLAVVVGNGFAIGPDADGGTGGIAVGLELLLAVLELGFF